MGSSAAALTLLPSSHMRQPLQNVTVNSSCALLQPAELHQQASPSSLIYRQTHRICHLEWRHDEIMRRFMKHLAFSLLCVALAVTQTQLHSSSLSQSGAAS